jgi:chromosome segregation ATPase
MSTLEQDLAELSDALPLLPAEVTALGGSAGTLEAAAETLLSEVGAGRQELESLLTHVRNALPGFTVQVEAIDKRLETTLEAVEKAWSEADDQLEEGEKALAARGEEVDTERAELLKVLFEAGTKVDQASADGDAAVDRLESAARDAQARVKTAADTVTTRVAALGTMLEQTTTAMADAAQVFMERITLFVDNANFDTDVLLDHLAHRLGQYTGNVEALGKEVETRVDAILNAGSARTYDNIREPLLTAGEEVRIAVERLAATASTQQESLAKGLDAHDAALTDVKQAAEPLPAGVEQIHNTVLSIRQQ